MSATLEPSQNATPASKAVLLTRTVQEPIQGLPYFSELILHAIRMAPDPQVAHAAFGNSLEGECLACGIRASGEEILALGVAPSASAPKVERLRMGYCARRTCDSRFYQITCKPAPGIDWSPIFAIKDGYLSAPEVVEQGEAQVAGDGDLSRKNRRAIFAIAAAGAALLMMVGWQLYAGGSIPFLREAEKFQVDTAPDVLELSRSQ
jgi:hypothetical protein